MTLNHKEEGERYFTTTSGMSSSVPSTHSGHESTLCSSHQASLSDRKRSHRRRQQQQQQVSQVALSFLLLLYCCPLPGTAGMVTQEVYSVVSGSAHLPCDITPDSPSDGARLVLWYKGGSPQPVYSFDARFSTVKHWSEDPTFGPRTYFRDSSKPAQLIISNVQMEDAGEYRCRVDFRETPTVTSRIILNIVEEPKKPVILDDEGSAVMGTIGPFRLQKPLILVCLVEGGNPLPEAVWWRDGQVYDREADPSTYEDVIQNTLVISALDRTFHDSLLECKAINNNVTEPPSANVRLLLELPILSLTVSNLPNPVTADVQYDVLCQVVGAQPPPKVTWRLGDTVLPVEEPRLTHNNNLTTSELHYIPKIKDHGKVLSCTADNSVFPSVNKSLELNVYYIPVVHVEIVSEIDPSNIREGDNLVLKCNIQAHPWVWRILWYKDGEELTPSDRTVIDEQRLVLKNVGKASSGQYVCSGSNVEGDGFSKPLLLSVNYKPVCVAPTIEYKGENRSEGIDLRCQVDAKPKSQTFRWLFNSSETRFEIPSAESVMSFGNYKATSGDEHGEVLCWASNELGEQSRPCVFHVVPLGAPQPPTDCQISNHTTSTIEVSCTPGFSGGLQQHFVMEVFETTANNSQVLVASNWTTEPTIAVWGLLPESNYIISVKSVNDRGESSPVYVGGKTEGFIQSLPRAVEESRLPMLFVIVGILLALMLLGALVTATIAIRKRKLNDYKTEVVPAKASVGPGSGASSGSTRSEDMVLDPEAELGTGTPLLQRGPSEPGMGGVSIMPLGASPGGSTMARKVSFREERPGDGGSGGHSMCPECQHAYPSSSLRAGAVSVNGDLHVLPRSSSSGLPIEKTVVRTFSIDKLRPICHVCNPTGATPYPTENPLDELHRSLIMQANRYPETANTQYD